jgi:hypothetical protein
MSEQLSNSSSLFLYFDKEGLGDLILYTITHTKILLYTL